MADEGAANHTRLCQTYDQAGVEIFVYGRSALDKSRPAPQKFPARQTLEACRAVARLHQLDPAQTLLVQQAPQAIDAGVFHNDVIAVGNRNFLMYHQHAFVEGEAVVSHLQNRIESVLGWKLYSICLTEQELSLTDAVASYLFNSQLLTRPDGGMTLLCPEDVQRTPAALQCTQRILAEENPVDDVRFLDLRQSMNNGGGPACLRLRVVMTDAQRPEIHQGVLFNDSLYKRLTDWVNKHYRDELAPQDLRDPRLPEEIETAFNELITILELPGHLFGF